MLGSVPARTGTEDVAGREHPAPEPVGTVRAGYRFAHREQPGDCGLPPLVHTNPAIDSMRCVRHLHDGIL